MIPAIDLIDSGNAVFAFEDNASRRILAVLQKPRVYSDGPYVITVPRTGMKIERHSAGLAYAAHKRLACDEYHSLNPAD